MHIPDYNRDADAFEQLRERYTLMERCHFEGRKIGLRMARVQFLLARRLYLICERMRRSWRRVSAIYLK